MTFLCLSVKISRANELGFSEAHYMSWIHFMAFNHVVLGCPPSQLLGLELLVMIRWGSFILSD